MRDGILGLFNIQCYYMKHRWTSHLIFIGHGVICRPQPIQLACITEDPYDQFTHMHQEGLNDTVPIVWSMWSVTEVTVKGVVKMIIPNHNKTEQSMNHVYLYWDLLWKCITWNHIIMFLMWYKLLYDKSMLDTISSCSLGESCFFITHFAIGVFTKFPDRSPDAGADYIMQW